jgi:hypothetical protein
LEQIGSPGKEEKSIAPLTTAWDATLPSRDLQVRHIDPRADSKRKETGEHSVASNHAVEN